MYDKQIDKRSKKTMTAFLQQHFRYHTMSGWNKSTSYANCIKLHHVPQPSNIDANVWWQMMELANWHDTLSDLLEDFGRAHDWTWQARINGRSGGYVVLYKGGVKPSGYKSYCTQCGQKNYQAVAPDKVGLCGRCHAQTRINFKQIHRQIFTWPGQAVDMNEDFNDWSMNELQARVELVEDFDKLFRDIVDAYLHLCKHYRITEEEILVPKTIKVLTPVV